MSDYQMLTKEEYIAELQEVLSKVETYKVRWFYRFIMAKLGIETKGGDCSGKVC